MRFHSSLLDILASKTRMKIVRFLVTHEASMSEREIASILKVSHMSVNRIMRDLADVHFCSFLTIGKSHVWKVNRGSYAFKALASVITDLTAIKNPISNLKTMLIKHIPAYLARKVVLFGSVARGDERPDSDIDLFVLVKNNHGKEQIGPFIEKASDSCFETYGNRLVPYILTEEEARKKKGLKLLSEIEAGIRII